MSDFKEYRTNLGPYRRSVSIIGTGCTPFRHTLNNPGWEGITENELLATAGLAAMDDAGILGKDVDALVQGQVFPHMGGIMNGNVHCMDWLGMRGKASWHIESACTTSALVIDNAVMAVASGKYDVVMAAGVDMAFSVPERLDKPNCYRRPSTSEEFAGNLLRWSDPTYARHIGCGSMYMAEDYMEYYMAKYNVTPEEIEDAFIGMAISNGIMNHVGITRLALLVNDLDEALAKIRSYTGVKILTEARDLIIREADATYVSTWCSVKDPFGACKPLRLTCATIQSRE